MSNRKLRHDLDIANKKIEKLANELEALRDELRSHPSYLPTWPTTAPWNPILPGSTPGTPWPWPPGHVEITCLGIRG